MKDICVECWHQDELSAAPVSLICDLRSGFYYCGNDASHTYWTSDIDRATRYPLPELAKAELERANLV